MLCAKTTLGFVLLLLQCLHAIFGITIQVKTCTVTKNPIIREYNIPQGLLYTVASERNLKVEPLLNVRVIGQDRDFCEVSKLKLFPIPRDVTKEAKISFTRFGHFGVNSWLNDSQKITTWYEKAEICGNIGRLSDGLTAIGVCETNPEDSVVEVIKCCPPGFIQDMRTFYDFVCVASEGRYSWKPTFYDPKSFNQGMCVSKTREVVNYRYVTYDQLFDGMGIKLMRHPFAYWSYNLTRPKSRWRLLSNGSISEKKEITGRLDLKPIWEEPESWYGDIACVDGIVNFHVDPKYNYKVSEIVKFAWEGTFTLRSNRTITTYTEEDEEDYPALSRSTKAYIYIVAYYLSLIPLTLMLLAYVLTWKSTNIHGWTILSHTVSLILGNAFSGTSALLDAITDLEDLQGSFCSFVGFGAHFFYLTGFMWLTLINFDIWWTFRNPKTMVNKTRDKIKYGFYALIACGIPLVIAGVSLFLDSYYGDLAWEEEDSDCEIITPRYGLDRCFVSVHAEGVYIFFPVGVLVIVNIIFFSLAMIGIFAPKLRGMQAFKGSSILKDDSFKLFLKLFLVMGCTFSFDFIAWISEPNVKTLDEISVPFFVISIFNILARAFALFYIFAWRNEVKMKCRSILSNLGFTNCLSRARDPVSMTTTETETKV